MKLNLPLNPHLAKWYKASNPQKKPYIRPARNPAELRERGESSRSTEVEAVAEKIVAPRPKKARKPREQPKNEITFLPPNQVTRGKGKGRQS